jgi:WD40 repeat protein
MAVLGAAVCFGYGWTTLTDQAAPMSDSPPSAPAAVAKQGDAADDPLPVQGVVRLGTARYRHGTRIESFAVSADGKLAVTSSSGFSAYRSPLEAFSPARVFDLTDGRCIYYFPNERGSYAEAVGLSPDGTILAVKDDKFITIRDTATGEVLRKVKYLPESGGGRSVTNWLSFTPDGKQIAAVMMGDAVRLIDVWTGEVTQTFEPGGPVVFSPDGKRMATSGYESAKREYFVRLRDVGTGQELRRMTVGEAGIHSLAFSPDGATLAAGGWRAWRGQTGEARLYLWETTTGKEPIVFPKIAADIASVAFSPDGKTVAAAGDNIYLYDPATGKERLRIERRAQGLAFSREGSVLTGAVSGAIYRWDAVRGRQLTPAAAQDSAVTQILVSADGRSLFTTDQEGDLLLWSTAGGQPPRRIAGGIERGVVASPDGRFLAWASGEGGKGSRLWLYDVAGQRIIDRFGVWAIDDCVAAFQPDGKALLTLSHAKEPAVVGLWDVESGKKGRSFAVPPSALLLSEVPLFTTRRAALSPDGKTLAIGIEWETVLRPDRLRTEQLTVPVRLWDVATGKAGRDLQAMTVATVPDEAGLGDSLSDLGGLVHVNRKMKYADGRAFSPDGRLLADWAENPYGRSAMDHVCVWDVTTSRIVATLAGGSRPGAANAAFSPDSRTFATASAHGTIRLWEVATWMVRTELHGHRDRITALAFGPDGRLFTGGLDTVVLGWDVRLTDSEAKTAFQAQGRFLAEPGKAVEWLAARVPVASLPDPARVKALIADLDKDDFATRELATADLREQGPAVAAALREVVARSTSAEARRRAEGMLQDMEHGVLPPRELRALRAAEVLEWIATPEARARLLELTKGAPDARLTREAAAACKRLEGRK